jgi:hypothetical protein
MSAQHVRPALQETSTGVQWRNTVFYILMIVCIALFVVALLPAWTFGDAYKERGPEAVSNQGIMLLWSFSIPIGVMLGLLGASIAARVSAGRAIVGVVAGLAVATVPFLVLPGEPIPWLFGAFGVAIELALVALIWFWHTERARLTGAARLASDLQVGGYMFFAFAAWFLCGLAAMPSFGLYPEKMIEFETREFAVRLTATIALCLVCGWVLSAVSQYLRAREARRA